MPTASGLRVHHRDPERVDRLSRQRAAAAIGDRGREDDGHPAFGIDFRGRQQRRLRAERVDDRFDEQHVDAAVDERAHLLGERVFI